MSEENSKIPNENTSSAEHNADGLDNAASQELEVPKICENSRTAEYFFSLEKRIRLSEQKEYDNLLDSKEFIRHKFLVKMPPDFYYFWEFLNELKPNTTGDNLLKHVEKTFQLKLVGAFEYVAGRFHDAKIHEPGDYLRHWRFFYDPPEFQTMFVRCNSSIHYGYWRDDPQDEADLLVARNNASETCVFDLVAGNLFDAFEYYLQNDFITTPFNARVVADTIKALHKFVKDHELTLSNLKTLQKKRAAKVVTKTFHRVGIVTPYDCVTKVGYRAMRVSESELKKILKLFEPSDNAKEAKETAMEKLQPIATAANIALDECDFGTALEFGLDLFCSGHAELHGLIQSLLIPTYKLLQRPQFLAILKAHLECRRKDNKLSIIQMENNK